MGVSTFDYVCACVHGVRMCTPVSGVTRYPDLGFADPGGQEHGGQTRISFAPPACTVLRGLLGSPSWEWGPGGGGGGPGRGGGGGGGPTTRFALSL